MKEYKGYELILNDGKEEGIFKKEDKYYYVNEEGYMIAKDAYVFLRFCPYLKETKENFDKLAFKKMIDIIEDENKLLRNYISEERNNYLKKKLTNKR